LRRKDEPLVKKRNVQQQRAVVGTDSRKFTLRLARRPGRRKSTFHAAAEGSTTATWSILPLMGVTRKEKKGFGRLKKDHRTIRGKKNQVTFGRRRGSGEKRKRAAISWGEKIETMVKRLSRCEKASGSRKKKS